jgi:putative transposase
VNRLCEIAGVSRAGYYGFLLCAPNQGTDIELRSEMQKIALEWPAYGYRRVHRELIRRAWVVNHKRVLRLMRIDNLLWFAPAKVYFHDRLQAWTAHLPQPG